jgi:hypothetical protein
VAWEWGCGNLIFWIDLELYNLGKKSYFGGFNNIEEKLCWISVWRCVLEASSSNPKLGNHLNICLDRGNPWKLVSRWLNNVWKFNSCPQETLGLYYRHQLPLSFFIIFIGVRLSPLGTAATTGLMYQTQMIRWWWLWSNWWNENRQGKPKY